jgi:hypothetical protein
MILGPNGKRLIKDNGKFAVGADCCCGDTPLTCAEALSAINGITEIDITIVSITMESLVCCNVSLPSVNSIRFDQVVANTGTYSASETFSAAGTLPCSISGGCTIREMDSAGVFGLFFGSYRETSFSSSGCTGTIRSEQTDQKGGMNFKIIMGYDTSAGLFYCNMSRMAGGKMVIELGGTQCATASTLSGPFSFSGPTGTGVDCSDISGRRLNATAYDIDLSFS